MITNKLREKIYTIPELIEDNKIMDCVLKSIRNLFYYLEYENEQVDEMIKRTKSSFLILKKNSRLVNNNIEYDLPKELLKFYEIMGYRKKRDKRTKGRAESIVNSVLPFLNDGTILDIGTGNSSVALKIYKAGHRIHTMDITDNRCKEAKECPYLDFKLHSCDEPLQYVSDSYDMVLAIAILHHCNDPLKLLDEIKRISRKKLIVYESTFGASKADLSKEILQKDHKLYENYFKLNREQQKMYCIFLDWFLNKIEYKNDAHITCNFTSPDKWDLIFKKKGFNVIQKKILGFDNPGISEFHIIYSLEKSQTRKC